MVVQKMAMSVPLGMATAGSCGKAWYCQAAWGIPLGLGALAEAGVGNNRP